MGLLNRFVGRVAVSDEYDGFDEEYAEDEIVDAEEDEEIGAEIAEIRPVEVREERVELARIVTLWPRVFDDAQEFADHFRGGVPVILNLSTAEDAVRNRIADFAYGVCYGLDGSIDQISNDVLLLTPRNVTIESPNPPHRRF